MWNVVGTPEKFDWIIFDPVLILDEFDFPRLFTCKDIAGNLYLAYNCGIDKSRLRFVVVPTDEGDISDIMHGRINLRDSLSKYRAWIFDLNNSWEPVKAWKINIDDLPFDALPRPGTMLRPDFQQVIFRATTRTCSSTTELAYAGYDDQYRKMVILNG